jgi:hypothetical protein
MQCQMPATGSDFLCVGGQDGINNDALLIDDCNNNPSPHHWLGDGYCDDGHTKAKGKGNCKIADHCE